MRALLQGGAGKRHRTRATGARRVMTSVQAEETLEALRESHVGEPRLPLRTEVIIVCYRSSTLVQELLESWADTLPVCIADNANGADGLEGIVTAHKAARYLRLDGLGFSRAANRAIRSSDADIVVIANPDCRASVENIVDLVTGLSHDPSALCHGAVEAIGPDRYYVGGWEPTFARCLVHALGLHRIIPRAGILAVVKNDAPPPRVDWLSGSLAAYWRSALLSVGGFDERFYVYTEDMALSQVSHQLGLAQVPRGDIVVNPHPSGSGSPSLAMGGLQGASLAHYFRGYHGPVSGFACRAVLALGFLGRAMLALGRGNRELYQRQMRFVSGITTGQARIAGQEVSRSRVRELQAAKRHELR